MGRLAGFALLLATALHAQSLAPTGTLKFEVGSVKRSAPNGQEADVRPAPGGRRYVGSNVNLRSYLYVAYQIRPEQVSGGPSWVDTEHFDLNAEAERPASIEDLHIMLQNFLTERFQLKLHHESKEMAVYALTVDKAGPKNLKLHPGASGGDVVLARTTEGLVHEKWNAHCASMDFLTWRLSPWLERPLLNQTNLDGCFDFDLSFTRDLPAGIKEGQLFNGAPIDTYGPTIFQALPAQLGLRLEAKRGPVDVLVIDHAEKPTED